MTPPADACGTPNRRVALVAVVALHAIAIWFWPSRPRQADSGPSLETAIVFVPLPRQAPPPTAAPPVRRPPQRAPAPLRAPAQPAITFIPAPASAAPEAAPETVPDPAPPPSKSMAEIRAQMKANIADTDKAVRNASPDMAVRTTVLQPTRMERAIASAAVKRGNEVEEYVGSDGRRISRVGNICMQKQSVGLSGGRDIIRDGVKTQVMTCPK